MSREAMQLALHTLEGWANYGKWVWPESALEQAKRNTTDSIAALRQALEIESEALRLADALDAEFVQGRISNSTGRESAVELRRLALKQWVGLKDEEIVAATNAVHGFGAIKQKDMNFAKAIEAKLREKNKW